MADKTPKDPKDIDLSKLKRIELLAFRIEPDLVPEWSNYVEKICLHHGENSGADFEDGDLVVRCEIDVVNKPGLMRDMERFWAEFVERRKRTGQWRQDT